MLHNIISLELFSCIKITREDTLKLAIEAAPHNTPSDSMIPKPTSRQILENLIRDGHLLSLIRAGARVHQAGCKGCIGMGQASATNKLSLRIVPRDFTGRSGAREDKVCLVSPETAAASALRGVITDPRNLGFRYPAVCDPEHPILNTEMLSAPSGGN